jgi:spore coat protein A
MDARSTPAPFAPTLRLRRVAPHLAVLLALFVLAAPRAATATVVTLPASRDNTLYENATGATSNGAGEYLFTGRTKDGPIRRAVIAFDVAAAIPAGSTINSVTLTLRMSRSANSTLRVTTLHRLLADWGEGASNAAQNEGEGAPAATGDATWLHRFYPATTWTSAGGDFAAAASASTVVTGNGTYSWTAAGLAADVQAWLDDPAANFGWLVRGDESVAETAKRFDSRQNGQAASRPALVVDYTAGGGGQTGACCLPDDECTVLTAEQCASVGGTYQGNNVPCSPDPCAETETAILAAAADNTLYESASGTLSNGAGTKMLASKNGGGLIRRSLVRFDLAAIPAGSTVTSATLTLYNVQATNATDVAVHRVAAGWGEGSSVATGNEDAGAPATTGDATWIHRFYPSTNWSLAGGDFDATARATATVGGAGSYAWSTPALAADVQAWLDDPATHFGWMLRGKETGAGNALKGFETRESLDPARRPRLEVTYAPPPPPPAGACCLPDGSCDSLSAVACAAAGGTYQGDDTACTPSPCSVVLTPYVDALPRPAVAVPVSGVAGGVATYVIPIREFTQQLHRDLPPTRLWGYNGTYPGPTLETTTGLPIEVTWQNDLRDSLGVLRTNHLLPVDECLHGPHTEGPTPRVVTHLHGGHVPTSADGYPMETMLPGEEEIDLYPVNQQAGTLWYHDHAMGITRLNVMLGMAGFFLVRDPVENALGLPAGEFEIALAIQDRSFRADGALDYPATWMDHFFGDKMLVNGKVWPYLQVKQGKYRFRVLNGCNSRVLHLALSNGATFQVIGTDLGLVAAPLARTSLLLSPGERAEIVVDFSPYPAGTQIVLTNDAPAPYPGEAGVGVIPNVMRFDVVGEPGHVAALPAALRPVPAIDPGEAVVTRDLVLKKGDDPCTGTAWLINDLRFDDVTENPVLGTTEIWRFVNASGVSHPMHMHLVAFQVLDRQPFQLVDGQIVATGPAVPADPTEMGFKDTAPVGPDEMLRVIARFEDYMGHYPYHCHVLEHEDNEMMRQFMVVPPVPVDGGPAARLTLVPGRPNPFATATTIVYELPRELPVRLAVYDAAGRAVRLLDRGVRPAGAHPVRWDGRDDDGRALASGLYLVRLQAGEETVVRKVMRVVP